MILDQRVTVPGTVDEAWAFLMDIPAVSGCVPGVEEMAPLGDDRYKAVMKVKVGSIRIRFEGTIAVVERNRDELRARLLAEGADRRVGGAVKAEIDMRLEPVPDGELAMLVHTDAAVLGKLGELGQAVMRKKSDQVMAQFAANMRAELGGNGGAEAAPVAQSGGAGERATAGEPDAGEAASHSPPAPARVGSVRRGGLVGRIRDWLRRFRARRRPPAS